MNVERQLLSLAEALCQSGKFRVWSGYAALVAQNNSDDFHNRSYAILRFEALNASTGESDFRRLAGHVLAKYMKSEEKWETIIHLGKEYTGGADDPYALEECLTIRFEPFNINDPAVERVREIETMIELVATWISEVFPIKDNPQHRSAGV